MTVEKFATMLTAKLSERAMVLYNEVRSGEFDATELTVKTAAMAALTSVIICLKEFKTEKEEDVR